MNNRHLVKGLFLITIALVFGLTSLRYNVGTLVRAGPGMFPLIVSGLLLLIGVATVVQARLSAPQPLHFNPRNIALIIGSLCGFVLLSKYLNMTAGIVFMVFFSALAGSSYSVMRNIKVSVGLIVVAFLFRKLLGLNLPLY